MVTCMGRHCRVGSQNASCSGGTCGTIFQITPSGAFTTPYTFCSDPGCADGSYATKSLVLAASGNLYGTTERGGANGGGTIFKITPTGTFTTLYNFCSTSNCSDGRAPEGLMQSTSGIFYGTTENGGTNGFGNIFAFSAGEPPFVITRPAIGIVGEVVTIVGYGLKGATSVTFNGTPATILKDEPTVIYAKVPAGATTGKVAVATPTGTLTSNLAFEVAP